MKLQMYLVERKLSRTFGHAQHIDLCDQNTGNFTTIVKQRPAAVARSISI